MNYKTDIPIYKNDEKLTQQLTMLFDDEMYEDIERIAFDLNISLNSVVRTLVAHGIKHCNIEADNGDSCRNCKEYLADDKENFVCCCEKSPYFASFRPKNSWCIHHKRR